MPRWRKPCVRRWRGSRPFSHDGLQTRVTEGCVTPESVVDRRSQREGVEHLIRHGAGVQGVLNRIAVRAQAADPHTVRAGRGGAGAPGDPGGGTQRGACGGAVDGRGRGRDGDAVGCRALVG